MSDDPIADEEDDRFADFDAAFAESDIKPLRLKLYGKVWELPGVAPAAGVLAAARLIAGERTTEDLSKAETLTLAVKIFPDEILDQWLAKGISTPELGDMIAWALSKYMASDGGGSGEAPAPSTGASSSSSGGDSSKPISLESTASI
jgi:hypothetical protein